MLSDPRPARAGIKIEISKKGLYRITGNDIQNAGVNLSAINPATLTMFRANEEIPIIINSAGSSFAASDTLEFYGQGIDNQYTSTDVYWLYWGGDAGKQMTWENGAIEGNPEVVSSFERLLTVEENHILWTETPNAPDADYWFWEKLTSPQTATYSFDIDGLVNNSADAVVTVYFQGNTGDSSLSSHHTIVSLNGNKISDDTWEGNIIHGQSAQVAQNLFSNGQNQIKIQSMQVSGVADVVYFNKIEIQYLRKLSAVSNQLSFNVDQAGPIKPMVAGFTNSGIRVFDITDPSNPKRISNTDIQAAQSGFSVAFLHQEGTKDYLAIATGSALTPDRITYRKYSNLKKASNAADYILITSKDFMSAVDKLVELRQRQGRAVKLVDIEEIYDVFSFGFFTPEAVFNFLQYAYQNWAQPLPKYVLLAGDSNLDYRHYFGTSKQNIVPVYLDKTHDLGLTPSDNHYGCVAGDDRVPELYIGRIPGDSASTIKAVVNKLIRYESTQHENSNNILFVADDDEIEFETLNDNLATYLPSAYTPQKVYTRLYNLLSNATKDIQSYVNKGMAITNFVGHGDVTRWGAEPYGGGDYILEPSDLKIMTNKKSLTFVLALDCLNGYFSQPFQYSLAEEWVKAANGGAVACLAPSGLSHQGEHEFFSQIVFSKIFLDSENILGAVATQSKINAYYGGASDNVLISFNLIGDPATRLAINRKASDLVAVHSITAEATIGGSISPPGETLVFHHDSQSYNITASTGYTISSVTVDGASKGRISSYAFKDVTADHTIRAVFDQEGGSGGGGGGGGCFVMTVME